MGSWAGFGCFCGFEFVAEQVLDDSGVAQGGGVLDVEHQESGARGRVRR